MGGRKLITICQSGGHFETNEDGSLSYIGGEAHAIDIDNETQFEDFKSEIVEMLNCSSGSMSIKYFLPGNKKTLITISKDKDLQRMITFSGDSITVDVYIIAGENVVHDVSNMPASRSSRTTLSEAVVPIDIESEAMVLVDATPVDMAPVDMAPVDVDVDVDVEVDNAIDVPIDIPIDSAHPPTSFITNGAKHLKVSSEWEDAITGVNQRFRSVHEFREALRKYAIAHGFAYKYKKNDSHRVTVKCKSESCTWRIHASRLSTTQLFCIKKMNPTHVCGGVAMTSANHATTNWVAGVIKEKLRDSPNYKPKDIVEDIKRDYGMELNYSQAWRAKDIAREQLTGSYKEAYSQLPFLCERILETNPGSFATFTTKEDSSFHRLFVAFHASVHGFLQGCRPLIFLDSTPLNSKYQGTLLAATAADGDDGVFPVAFGVVDAETDDNWRWFLKELKSAISASQPITFVADMEKGLRESIAEIFGSGCYHAYCLRYLTDKFKRDIPAHFSNEVRRLLVADFNAAAHTFKLEEFERYTDSIKSISPEAFSWILQSKPAEWANVFFTGARYNHMKSNFGELFYSWVSEAHDLPVTQMVDLIRCKMMEMIHARRMGSNRWLTKLTPSMEEKLHEEALKARSLSAAHSMTDGTFDGTFEVRGDSFEKVNIEQWHCSCRAWQITGIPCRHAITVFNCISRSPYDFCSRYFLSESYRMTYSKSIIPVPNVGKPVQEGSSPSTVKVTPPPTRRPPGRPKTNRSWSEGLDKRKFQCSKCKGMGHNKLTCKEVQG